MKIFTSSWKILEMQYFTHREKTILSFLLIECETFSGTIWLKFIQ